MYHTPFYHQTIRKLVVGFGTLFHDIKLVRTDSAGGNAQTINVPLSYGPKEKWAVRTDQDPGLVNNIYTTLPRMGFEITGYNYDTSRMVNRNNNIKHYDNSGNLATIWAPVPYNVDISLYALTKGSEDGFALAEQILPLFAPEYNLNLIAIPSMNVTQDVPVILNGVSVQDDYEGDFNTRRFVTHTFTFTAKINLYGAVKDTKIITSTKANIDTSTPQNGADLTHDATGAPTTGVVTDLGWTFN